MYASKYTLVDLLTASKPLRDQEMGEQVKEKTKNKSFRVIIVDESMD